MECTDCHQFVETEEFAGRPTLEMCSGCHEEAMTESAEEEKLITFIEAGEEVPWQRLYNVPDHVFYSHRRHVSVAGLECTVCHGDIAATTEPPSKPLNRLTMSFCLDCHETEEASTDCNVCHR